MAASSLPVQRDAVSETGAMDLVSVTGELANLYKCPLGCEGGFVEDTRNGDVVCKECGCVLPERVIDPGREWRDFSDSTDDKSRVSVANEFMKDGLGTTISVPVGTKGGMGKLQNRLISGVDRNMLAASEKIDNIAHMLSIPEHIQKRAKRIYLQFEEKRTKSMRYKTDAIIAAIIYMACKEEQYPRTFKEIARETTISEKEIRKYYRTVNKLLERQDMRTSAADLVNRFCSRLGLPFNVIVMAQHVANEAMQFVEGKSPSSIAAASILLVSKLHNEKRLEKDIAEAASISPTTIRNVYKDLLPHQDKLLPKNAMQSISKSGSSAAFAYPSPSSSSNTTANSTSVATSATTSTPSSSTPAKTISSVVISNPSMPPPPPRKPSSALIGSASPSLSTNSVANGGLPPNATNNLNSNGPLRNGHGMAQNGPAADEDDLSDDDDDDDNLE